MMVKKIRNVGLKSTCVVIHKYINDDLELNENKDVVSFLNRDPKIQYYLELLKDPFYIKNPSSPLIAEIKTDFNFIDLFSNAINENHYLMETKAYSITQYYIEIKKLLDSFLVEFYLLNKKINSWSNGLYHLFMKDKQLFVIDNDNQVLCITEKRVKKYRNKKELQVQMEISFLFKREILNIIIKINHIISKFPF